MNYLYEMGHSYTDLLHNKIGKDKDQDLVVDDVQNLI